MIVKFARVMPPTMDGFFLGTTPPPTGHPGKEFNCRCYAEPTNYTNDAERTFGEVLLGHEGGFVDDPVDRGGATKYGVTIANWRRYARPLFGIEPSVATLRQITPAMASEIFWVGYWERFGHVCSISKLTQF